MVNTRLNSLKLQFQRSDPKPSNYDLYRFLLDSLGLTVDGLIGLQVDTQNNCVIVKLCLESRFDKILSTASDPVQFRYSTGHIVSIKLSDANAVTKTVSVAGLPFELSDTVLKCYLEKYGKVKQIRRDTWHDEFFGDLENGCRTVIMELQTQIPSRVIIEGATGYVKYSGQEKTCHYCHQSGHFVITCPKKSKPGSNDDSHQKKIFVQPAPPPPVMSDITDPKLTYSKLAGMNSTRQAIHVPETQESPVVQISKQPTAEVDDIIFESSPILCAVNEELENGMETFIETTTSLPDMQQPMEEVLSTSITKRRKGAIQSRSPSPMGEKKKKGVNSVKKV